MANILLEYKWAYRTNLPKKLLAPKDAVILLLKDGHLPRKTIIGVLKEWRKHSNWGHAYYIYLFNASYHHVANSVRGDITDNYREKSPTYDRAYWYRVKRGVYGLSLSGIKRLHELGF